MMAVVVHGVSVVIASVVPSFVVFCIMRFLTGVGVRSAAVSAFTIGIMNFSILSLLY